MFRLERIIVYKTKNNRGLGWVLQRWQKSVILRAIVHAYRFSHDGDIHRDIQIMLVDDVIEVFKKQHENHVKAVKLLETYLDIRHFKRSKPQDRSDI